MTVQADFDKIYADYSDMVYNLSLNYLQNSEEAEDVTQEVFIKVHFELDKFKEESSLKTWIYRITINQCLDHIKKENRKKRKGIRISLFNKEETYSPVEFKHPGILMEDQENLERIFRGINQLAEKQKTAILLKSVEEMSQKEIAEIMKLSEKAVESLLSRGRKKLAEILNKTKD